MDTKVKVGQVFNTSWGYDQTNYDFVVVKSISPSGKTVLCQKAAKIYVGHTTSQDILKPSLEGFGSVFRMRVEYNNWREDGKVYLRGSYPYLSRFEDDWTDEQKADWSKSTRLGTFSLCEETDTYHQTNPMFGH
ncbi:hypothetical protein CMI37_30065 [Candidatus Pacearchaeota archaeon]|nr:hypothetical protein [Candidatus Pacearchaeota archaeon]|tara:strand:- start:10659 stop:11060 length:402 start_codon:yes stop_codon:yes gene_type:complete